MKTFSQSIMGYGKSETDRENLDFKTVDTGESHHISNLLYMSKKSEWWQQLTLKASDVQPHRQTESAKET